MNSENTQKTSWFWWMTWTALSVYNVIAFMLLWVTLPWSVNSGVPLYVVCAIWVVVGAIVMSFLARATPVISQRALCVLPVIFAMWLFYSDGDSRMRFCHDLSCVQIGMTRNQAKDIMSRWELRGENRTRLGYGHSDDADYNADVGSIHLIGNRVTRVEFSPD